MNKVLVVNDCKFEGMILNDMLSQMGYNVHMADEYSAMSHIQSFTPDVVMVNYIMKETRGDKLIQIIKAKHPDIACILSSNKSLDAEQLNCNRIDALMKTPINKQSLVDTIKDALDKSKEVKSFDIKGSSGESAIKSKLVRWKQKAEGDINKIAAEKTVSQNVNQAQPDLNTESFNKSAIKFSYCPYCGNDMKKEQNSFIFCPKCGNKL